MYRFQEILTDAEWDKITVGSERFSQSSLFFNIQKDLGRAAQRYAIYQDQSLVGYFLVVVYPLYRSLTSMYTPHGPVVFAPTRKLLRETAEFLQTLGQTNNAVYVRVDEGESIGESLGAEFRKTPAYAYPTVYHQPRGEWLLDITPDSDTLLADMHKKSRYNLRKSLKQGLDTDFIYGERLMDWADTFIALNQQNMSDHGTTTHTKKVFKTLFAHMAKDPHNFIAITKKEHHVLAINLFVRFGDLVFCPFGASNDVGKDLGAYYHIKWHAILEMQKNNVQRFNWGGVSVGIHDEYLSGITQFKKGFGGNSIVHGELYDIVIKPLWYWVYMLRKKFT